MRMYVHMRVPLCVRVFLHARVCACVPVYSCCYVGASCCSVRAYDSRMLACEPEGEEGVSEGLVEGHCNGSAVHDGRVSHCRSPRVGMRLGPRMDPHGGRDVGRMREFTCAGAKVPYAENILLGEIGALVEAKCVASVSELAGEETGTGVLVMSSDMMALGHIFLCKYLGNRVGFQGLIR
jgi:hypothetical protein